MAKLTQKTIMKTFEEMLDEMPFSKITVSELVERSEISSNTFYYHFSDIFDLLNVWLDKRADEYYREMNTADELPDKLKLAFRILKANSRRANHIFDSISRDRLERYVFTHFEKQFYADMNKYVDEEAVSAEGFDRISQFFCYAFLGFVLRYIWDDMKADIDSSVDELWRIFDGLYQSVIKKDNEK
ncbi:MAG: TetR/AcrR family transcriptional regulator C-terminal domain-containing protein [Erysipelotrichaceae bacterium]|nr:TetR/AcrR family transcriptional regulator C-terminal domain-containing protein [Erysipelotrichaceae bacterium]